jgi:alpha-tubulin suppressor-like RCC1 family protein
MRCLLLLAVLGACDPTLEPVPPSELYGAVAYSVAPTTIGYLSVEPTYGETLVGFQGTEIAAPVDDAGYDVVDLPASRALAVGTRHACVISTTGTVHCWGDQTGGALGAARPCTPPAVEGGTPNCILPVGAMPVSMPPAHAIAAGDDVTCIITDDDRVVCWGDRSLTAGSLVPLYETPLPVALPGGEQLEAERLIITHGTVCALDVTQRLWCWGEGFGDTPSLVGEGVVDAAFGTRHHCLINSDGLFCSGDNRNGQLGDTAHAKSCDNDGRCTATNVLVGIDAVRVAVGERHTCALSRTGTVHCFGSNEVGQLGRNDAFLVGDIGVAIDGAVDLSAGFAHTCARRTDETVWCWGSTDAAME